jgi:L-glyceraldehyde 3-phosphate reductase
VSEDKVAKILALNNLAQQRGQTLAQMALAWILKDQRITSVLIGVSKTEQLTDCLNSLDNLAFTQEELNIIEEILK